MTVPPARPSVAGRSAAQGAGRRRSKSRRENTNEESSMTVQPARPSMAGRSPQRTIPEGIVRALLLAP